MVRATWVKPMTMVQKFEANEAVTSCLQLVCKSSRYVGTGGLKGDTNHPASLDGPDPWGRSEYLGASGWEHNDHRSDICHVAGNDRIILENGTIEFTGDRWLAKHVDVNENGKVDAPDRVYWCENSGLGGLYKWNHWGTVEMTSNKS